MRTEMKFFVKNADFSSKKRLRQKISLAWATPATPDKANVSPPLLFCPVSDINGVYHEVENKRVAAANGQYLAFFDMQTDERKSVIIDKLGNEIDGNYPPTLQHSR